MFSNLTSQVSGWMGKKGEGEGEKPPEDGAPPAEDTQPAPNPEEDAGESAKKDASPTKGGSRLEMLGNLGGLAGTAKSQMSSWLGGGIPGLKKAEPAEGDAPVEPSPPKSPKGSPTTEKDDDASSATGGADSDHVESLPTTPTEDKEGGQTMGAVSTKAIAGAKSFGNFLYSAVNKAGAKVTEASAKIKKTVEENSGILGEFNKEQEAFIKEKQAKGGGAPVAPWVGCPNQDALKEECLSLSTDRRNFVRAPPEGVDFTFDYDTQFPVCQAILAEDPNLEKMRFELVPKVISEENFWRNYLYRVNLICQANEVSSMVQESEGGSVDRTNSVDGQAPETWAPTEPKEKLGDPAGEFVSDAYLSSNPDDLEEVKEGIKRLGLAGNNLTEEDWERELEAELQDYEMVGQDDKSIELLESDLTDLK